MESKLGALICMIQTATPPVLLVPILMSGFRTVLSHIPASTHEEQPHTIGTPSAAATRRPRSGC